MKAVVVARAGGPEVLEVRDVPDPVAQPGEVIVRVEAVGVNFADTLSTRGTSSADSLFNSPVNAAYASAKSVNIARAGGQYVIGSVTFGGAYRPLRSRA